MKLLIEKPIPENLKLNITHTSGTSAGWRHALRSEWPFIIIIISGTSAPAGATPLHTSLSRARFTQSREWSCIQLVSLDCCTDQGDERHVSLSGSQFPPLPPLRLSLSLKSITDIVPSSSNFMFRFRLENLKPSSRTLAWLTQGCGYEM